MSAIGSSTSGSQAQPKEAGSAYSALTSGEFLEIMFTELVNQDPLAPTETKDILNQIASVRSIESDLELTKNLNSLVKQSELSAAGAMVGKYVTGLDSSGVRTEGFVISVRQTREGAQLNLSNNKSLLMTRVEDIIDPAIFAQDAAQ